MYVFESNTLLVEDCLFYDPLTSDSGKYSFPSQVTHTYNEEGMTLTASSYCLITGTASYTLEPCILEVTVNKRTTTSLPSPIIFLQDKTVDNTYIGVATSNSNYMCMMVNKGSSSNKTIYSTPQNGEKVQVIYTGSKVILKNIRNSTTTVLGEYTWTPQMTEYVIRMDIGTNRSCTIKDLKIKPYSI